MSKHQAAWQKDDFSLRPFAKGEGEKYYLDCFSHPDPEADRLTGSAASFPRQAVIDHYERAVEDPDRYDFVLVAPDGTFAGEAVINEMDWDARCANFRIALFSPRWPLGCWGCTGWSWTCFPLIPGPGGYTKSWASRWKGCAARPSPTATAGETTSSWPCWKRNGGSCPAHPCEFFLYKCRRRGVCFSIINQ